MFPHDISLRDLTLPPGDRHSAVIVSGSSLRHAQFGYKLQERFPGLLKKWWVVERSGNIGAADTALTSAGPMRRRRFRALARNLRDKAFRHWRQRADGSTRAELRMFECDVTRLKAAAEVHPIPTDGVISEQLVEEARALSPYFLFLLDGPLLEPRLFKVVRGLVINQHAGWLPEYKGGSSHQHALYRRDVTRVANAVHLVELGSDSGAILRRSTATLHPDDDEEDCFMAAVALGTELALEVVGEALRADSVSVFEPRPAGHTYLAADWTTRKRQAVRRDFASGWLADAIEAQRDW